MLKEERYERILEYLRARRTARLEELAALNAVSTYTARRDLAQLEEKGLLQCVRGGAVLLEHKLQSQSFVSRSLSNTAQKQSLARHVTEVVREGQTVALNHGTTNIEAAAALCTQFQRLSIVTTSFAVLQVLCQAGKFSVIVPGGIADLQEGCLYGGHCEREIRRLNIDVALIAANAISLEKGVTDFRLNETGVMQAMLSASQSAYIMADASKLESVSCMPVCSIRDITGIVTDEGAPREIVALYEEAKVKVYM